MVMRRGDIVSKDPSKPFEIEGGYDATVDDAFKQKKISRDELREKTKHKSAYRKRRRKRKQQRLN